MHIHLDPQGGIAGDMFLAALLDAFPEHEAGVVAAMRAAGLPAAFTVDLQAARDHGLSGRRLLIRGEAPAPAGAYPAIRERIAAAPLAPAVRERAEAILALIAEAEAAVHGVPVERVHFHELAGWDSIADIVGAAWLIEAIRAGSWSVAALPLGGGRIETAHGPLPVPAPATARLLEGFALVDDGIGGERVTPTGAAILRHLQPAPRAPRQPHRLVASGTGFGTRRLPGQANVLRALALAPIEAAAPAWRAGEVGLVTFEIDDQSPEDLALGLDALRRHPGVLDVLQIAAVGKKGRLAVQVQVLCRPEALVATIALCLDQTTTLGLRHQIVARAELSREESQVEAGGHGLRVKRARRPGGAVTTKVEADDLAPAGDAAARAALRRRGEATPDEGEPG